MEKNKVFIFSLVTVFAVSLVVLFVNSISVQAVKSGSCQSGAATYCGQQDPINECWCDSYAIGYGDNCADIETVCPDVVGGSTKTTTTSSTIKAYSESDIPSYCDTYGSASDTICDDTKANCASGYDEDNSDASCMECTTGKWSNCKTGGSAAPVVESDSCNYVYHTVPYGGYVIGKSNTWSIHGMEFSYPADKCSNEITYTVTTTASSGCDSSATSITPTSIKVTRFSGITQDVFSLKATRSQLGKICNVGMLVKAPNGKVVSAGNFTLTSFVALGDVTPAKGITYGSYTYYSDLGSIGSQNENYKDAWARILIKDASSNTADTLVMNRDNSKTSSIAQTTVSLLNVLAYPNGTIVQATIGIEPV